MIFDEVVSFIEAEVACRERVVAGGNREGSRICSQNLRELQGRPAERRRAGDLQESPP